MTPHTPSWDVVDRYVERLAAVDPDAAAALGKPMDVVVPDLSPDGFSERQSMHRDALAQLDPAWDDPLAMALRERLGAETALYDAGFTTTLLAPLATPVHRLREIFDDLPRDTDDDWHRVARNLRAASAGFAAYRRTLQDSAQRGHRIAARQTELVAAQCESWIDPAGANFFRSLVTDFSGAGQLDVQLQQAAEEATRAVGDFIGFLRSELAPHASSIDPVGREMYQVTSAAFLGAQVDLMDLYEYGWAELRRLSDEATTLATDLTGESDHQAGCAVLDERPEYAVAVGAPLLEWLQQRLDDTAETLIDKHFDVDDRLRPVDARMMTAGSGVMYYSPPDPELTRPGRVWWSTSPGVERISTWREVSTVHHEGLPGHHLQHAITMGVETLHPWQRYLCHVHGYAEGWAHYSEQLSVELGLVRDGAERLGVIHAQLWRAARIVIDLGLHLQLPIPSGTGLIDELQWTPEVGAAFLSKMAGTDSFMAKYEVDRYLGWPGQALAFKTGARLWDTARSDQQRALGDRFDLKDFHMTALRLGVMGLDPLRTVLAQRSH